jgi:cytoplasmic iron level regulating protein YaaA (DUF328/UPF0246 family)
MVETTKPAPKTNNTQEDLTKELDGVLNKLRELIKKRNERIIELRAEIEQLEQENSKLDERINGILSDI